MSGPEHTVGTTGLVFNEPLIFEQGSPGRIGYSLAPCDVPEKKAEALGALRKARAAGFEDSDWARRDPDLSLLHGDPEFEQLYPPARQ